MTQPQIRLKLFMDYDTGKVNVDVDSEDGAIGCAFVAEGNSERAAYRMAARRLRMLAKQADKHADKLTYT